MKHFISSLGVTAVLGGFLLIIGACGALELDTISMGRFMISVGGGFALTMLGLLGITAESGRIDE